MPTIQTRKRQLFQFPIISFSFPLLQQKISRSPSTNNNNYAAPNSPIASSKRQEIKSPTAKPSAPKVAVPATTSRKGSASADHTVAPALFSPQLTKGDEKEAEEELNDEEEEEEEEEEEAFNPYLFIAGLPPHHSVVIRDKICLSVFRYM